MVRFKARLNGAVGVDPRETPRHDKSVPRLKKGPSIVSTFCELPYIATLLLQIWVFPLATLYDFGSALKIERGK